MLRRIVGHVFSNSKSRPAPSLAINPHPVAIQRTPDSILDRPAGHQPLYIGGRSRLAGCSGVAWFHNNHLATVSVLGRSMHVYRFDAETKTVTLLQTVHENSYLAGPENLAISPDGSILAISDSFIGVVRLYEIDSATHQIDPNPCLTIDHAEDNFGHGISFSPCGRFLAFTTVDDPGQIRILRMVRDASGVGVEPVQNIANTLGMLKPKGIDFSPDGHSIAVCYGPNAGFTPVRGRCAGKLMLYAFDDERGMSEQPISVGPKKLRLMSPDDVKFLPSGDHVVVTQQATDEVSIVAIDRGGTKVRRQTLQLQSPPFPLSFPHGVGISSDSPHLAITNYGDDTFAIYEIERPRTFQDD